MENKILPEMITISREEYEKLISKSQKLEAQNKTLETQVQWLSEQLALANARKYGSASEKIDPNAMEQLSLFANEAEWYLDYKPTKEEQKVSEHIRRKRSGSVIDIVPEDVPREVVEHRIDNPICSECGETMTEIGKESRYSLKIVPATVTVVEDVYYSYACKKCEQNNVSTPVVKTPRDNPVIKGSFASPEAVAHIMTQKFVMGSPLYRQELELNRMGVDLSRQTMSNWILTASESWLSPLYDRLHEELAKREVLHADETTLRVLKEPGKGSNSKCYMWLYRTSGNTDRHIVLYDYQRDRKAEHPKEFLKGFKGYLHADGYAGYHKLSDEIIVAGCFAHLKRKFREAADGGIKDESYITASRTGESYISRLMHEDSKLEGLNPEERQKARLEIVKPIFEALLSWAKTIKAAPKSKLGGAIHYLFEQQKYLENCFRDGRCELTNNRAERSIKPFVIDRKNFLFANTPSGAKQTGIMFSIIETAKENGLDPYSYLRWLFVKMPNTDLTVENSMDQFLPWNAPNECRSRIKG
ncbi:MAG: IS66 family transposase [Clostridia bacterium]|nr:IS66 family transposase [Clostridia bacterium]